MANYVIHHSFLKSIFIGLQLRPFVSTVFMVAFMLHQQIRDTMASKA